MKPHLPSTTLRTLVLACAFLFLSKIAFSQTPFTGPSDAVSTPPAAASNVGKVLCEGGTISLVGPEASPGVPFTSYQWYKINSSGVQTLVKTGADKTYTETTAGAGYYNYKLIVVNSNGCSSEISDLFKLFTLPALTPSINASADNICEGGQTSTTLTASVTPSGYSYNYQWTRNGTPIAGATSPTYVASENTAGSVNYGVNVSFVLNSSCSQTASKTITVIALPGKPTIQIGN